MIHLTFTPCRTATLELSPCDATAEELCELLSEVEVGDKDGLALIPARFGVCPEQCRNALNPKAMHCGGGVHHRLGANVVEMTMLGADLDDVPEAALQAVIDGLKAKGLAFWAWETFSHEPGSGKARARILIPLKEPVPLRHPRQWSQIAWPALIKAVGLDRKATADSACRDPARIYYTPRKPTEEAVREGGFVDGEPLDWRAILGDALEGMAVATAEPKPYEPDPERPVDLEAIRGRLKRIQNPPSLATLLGNVLHGDAPAPPPEKRHGRQPTRYIAWRSVTSAVANAAEGWEDPEALLELLKASYASEVAEDPDGHTDWDIIVGLLETALANAGTYKAQREAEQAARIELLRREMRKHDPPKAPSPPRPQEPPSEAQEPGGNYETRADHEERLEMFREAEREALAYPDDPPPAAPAQAEDDWTDGLIFVTRKNGDIEVRNTAANVEHMLRCSPAWRGVLRLNLATRKVEMHGGPLLEPGQVAPFVDHIVAHVADWLERQPEGRALSVGDNIVLSRMRAVAAGNAYDPIQDYLHALKWDGVERIDTALARYWACPLVDENGTGIEDYLRTISRRWFISAAARALQPGCKVDTVLVLEGETQGEGKSTSLEALGGDWYTAQHIDIHNKDSWAIITSKWIVELGELETLRRSEATAQKAFLSLQADEFRRAYGVEASSYPRRCIFVGTTNKTDYLKDETGNRRYWPVRVGEQIDVADLRRDRDQLWAEAVHLFKAAETCEACEADLYKRCERHRWWLTREEDRTMDVQRNARQADDLIADAIERELLSLVPEQRPAFVPTLWIVEKCLQRSATDSGLERAIATSARRLGLKHLRRLVDGSRQRGYELPAHLRTAPQRKRQVQPSDMIRQMTKEQAKA
jgi:predicted P-loop ATPase